MLGSASVTGTVPRGGAGVQRLCFADAAHAAGEAAQRCYTLVLHLTYDDGSTRNFEYRWRL